MPFKLALVVSVFAIGASADCQVSQQSDMVGRPSVDRCNFLLQHAIELMESGELTSDLTLPYDSPRLVCPMVTQGKDATQFCRPVHGGSTNLSSDSTTSDEWAGMLFDNEILQMIISPRNHGICSDIFSESDLVEKLRSVPKPSVETVDRYKRLGAIWTIIFVPEKSPEHMVPMSEAEIEELSSEQQRQLKEFGYYIDSKLVENAINDLDDRIRAIEFSDVQQALISVFESVNSWNYCNSVKRSYGSLISGRWYPRDGAIVLYKGYCQATKLYDIEISSVVTTHRALFTISHEFGHATENLTRQTSSVPTLAEQEVAASYYGSYFAQCGARLFTQNAKWNLTFADSTSDFKRIDREYAYCQAKQVDQLERYFAGVRQQIRATDEVPEAFSLLVGEAR